MTHKVFCRTAAVKYFRPRCKELMMAGRSFVPIFHGCRSVQSLRRTCKRALQQRLLSNGAIPPLNEPLPNMPAPPLDMVCGAVWQNRHDHVTHVTTLDNGIKVASEDSFGQFSTVGGKLWISLARTDTDCLWRYRTSFNFRDDDTTHVLNKFRSSK